MRIKTACTLDCPDTCSLLVDKSSTGKVKIRGNPDQPFTAGITCSKITKHPTRLAHPDRIRTPLLRHGGGWREITWAKALVLCAENLGKLRTEPRSILHIDGHGYKGLLSKVPRWFFTQIGASQVGGSLCDQAGIEAYMADFGQLTQNDPLCLLEAERIVNWGKDLSRSSVHTATIIKKARRKGAGVLSISPGGDGNAGFSDQTITLRPGTDRFLAAAIIKQLLEGGAEPDRIAQQSPDWPGFRELLDKAHLADLLGTCQVSRADLELLEDWYGGDGDTATVLGWGLQRHPRGAENVRFINALALFAGNIGKAQGGSYFGVESSRNFNLDWGGVNNGQLPVNFLRPTLAKDLVAAAPPISMLWVTAANIVNQAPDSRAIAHAFEQIPFKVVVEAFMTDTALRADLILPPAMTLEREDLVGAVGHDFISYARPAFDPPDGALPDHEIVTRLGRLLDPPVSVPQPEDIFRTSLDSPHLETSLEEIREKSFVRALWPRVAFENGTFAHPDGLPRLPQVLHPEPAPPEGYPLRLLSLIRGKSMHSQILEEDQVMPPEVWIGPENPCLNRLDLDKEAYLSSPLGRILVKPVVVEGLHPQAVIYRRGDWMKLGGGVNRIIAPEMTDLGQLAAFYGQYVRLEN